MENDMFIKETKETKNYERTSKFGKLVNYKRTKTIIHCKCDKCEKQFTRNKNGPYDQSARCYCKECISYHGLHKLRSRAGYEARITNTLSKKVGNEILAPDGYPEIYIGKNYPYREGGYRSIRKHVYVMECHLKRGLLKGEIVHHIDGDKKNNDISNLYLTSVAEHNKLHAASESIIFSLVIEGKVIFNRTKGRYELK